MHHQAGPCGRGILGVLNHGDHPLQGLQGGDQTLHHLQTVFRFAQGMARAPDQGQFPVIEERLQKPAQGQLLGLAIHEGQHDGAEIALQGCPALEILQNRIGIGIAAQFHHDAHSFAVAFISDVGDAADLAVVDLFSQLFNPPGFTQLVGQFGHDHRIAFVTALAELHLFHMGDTAHGNASATAQVGVSDPAAQQHFTAGGEIGSRDQAEQLVVAQIRFAHQGDQSIHHLSQVVGRDAGGHAHSDA